MLKKRMCHISLLCMSIFCLGLFGYLVNYRSQLPRILIVHSYGNDYSWVQQINQGLQRVLDGKTNFTVYWQYLDTKNHPSLTYKQKAGLAARRLVSRLQPSVIITVDDEAQDLVGKFYLDDPDIAIVFCGVNGELQTYAYDKAKNVTGILERLPLPTIKDIIPLLVPSPKDPEGIKIINLGDQSKTVKFDESFILKFDWHPLHLIDSILVSNYEDWKNAVLESSKRADCLYITNYRQLETFAGSGHFVPPAEVMHWTEENSGIPVLGGNGFIVEDGGNIAVAASAYEQGEMAARYALEIIAGRLPSTLSVIQTRQFLVFMRKNASSKYRQLPALYENFARGIGKFLE